MMMHCHCMYSLAKRSIYVRTRCNYGVWTSVSSSAVAPPRIHEAHCRASEHLSDAALHGGSEWWPTVRITLQLSAPVHTQAARLRRRDARWNAAIHSWSVRLHAIDANRPNPIRPDTTCARHAANRYTSWHERDRRLAFTFPHRFYTEIVIWRIRRISWIIWGMGPTGDKKAKVRCGWTGRKWKRNERWERRREGW